MQIFIFYVAFEKMATELSEWRQSPPGEYWGVHGARYLENLVSFSTCTLILASHAYSICLDLIGPWLGLEAGSGVRRCLREATRQLRTRLSHLPWIVERSPHSTGSITRLSQMQ